MVTPHKTGHVGTTREVAVDLHWANLSFFLELKNVIAIINLHKCQSWDLPRNKISTCKSLATKDVNISVFFLYCSIKRLMSSQDYIQHFTGYCVRSGHHMVPLGGGG